MDVKKMKLVESLDEVISNVEAFNEEIFDRDRLDRVRGNTTDRLAGFRHWYAIRSDHGWKLGASKLIGYKDCAPSKYNKVDANKLDGRETEDALSFWFVNIDKIKYRRGAVLRLKNELKKELTRKLSEYGKSPNKKTVFHVLPEVIPELEVYIKSQIDESLEKKNETVAPVDAFLALYDMFDEEQKEEILCRINGETEGFIE